MSKVLIIGAGGVGTVVAHKVAASPVFTEIMLASRTKSKADDIAAAVGGGRIKTARVDADSVEELTALMRAFRPDIVINVALPYQDLTIMDACLECGVNYLETIGTAVGLAYLWLEYRASIWLWLAGIVMPAIYIFVYYSSGFYADMAVNVYYLGAGIYGWFMWRKRGGSGEEAPIARMPLRLVAPLAFLTAAVFATTAAVLVHFTDSTVPYGDSFTTALSITALWMLSRKYAEQWLVWIAVDIVSAGLYFYKGLCPTGVLYTLYAVAAVAGYFKWLKMMKNGKTTLPDA